MLTRIISDRDLKPKEKTEALKNWLHNNPKKIGELISFASSAKDPIKATCIEAIEFATKTKPESGTEACLQFAVDNLSSKAPRVKWESAKLIGNIAHLYPTKLSGAIKNLLINTEHEGTVVRWSAAFALGEIIKLKTSKNKDLVPAVEAIMKREEKNSIKKIYAAALKKVG